MSAHSRKYAITPLLLLWFFLWGICPWDGSSAAAQPLEAAHAQHGHHGTDDAHHASKGSEHSCSGAISLVKNELPKEKELLKSVSLADHSIANPLYSLHFVGPLPRSFSNTMVLPKLLSNLYQLHSNYRI